MKPLTNPFTGVKPIEGERLVFTVRSRSRNLEHRVDLEAFNGGGFCGCERWAFTCGPKLNNGAHPNTSTMCKHVRSAYEFFGFQMVQEIASRLGKGK